ncbi:dynein axonemal assembly factor 8 [Hypanus sabinus]|uniref:dynein axonemal assembly factor 8 n=1 Tax=Hypanus sabinus TaxID=79690 RepID=UPI0028C3DC16|nr:dynein axonemal assembly factor 8 [Hypanus sabinus]XP_059834818.1 dynein axonemal assembly factor 8 [Hypanus sabinus]XP_059834820.1 dynein axonemal assembly factor 8 [Hypanus sabinus]
MNMTSNENGKVTQVDGSSCDRQRTDYSLTTLHNSHKSYWDMIFAHVKDELPSLDSDFSSSGSEDGEVAIFQREATGLISCLPEDLRNLTLEDPVLEEMLESASCPPEAWATENRAKTSDDHEDFRGKTTWHLQNFNGINDCLEGELASFSGDSADSTPSVGLINDRNLLHPEIEPQSAEKEHFTDARGSGGGDPYSSSRQKVISGKEQKSLRCQASGDGKLDYWCIPTPTTAGLPELTAARDFVKNILESTSQTILDKAASEKHLMNSSKNQELEGTVSEDKLNSGDPMSSGPYTQNPPILSLECVEEAYLDEILRSLQHIKDHDVDRKDHSPDVENLVNSSWSGSVPSRVKSENYLMEQLALFCTKQSGAPITFNNQVSTEYYSSREQWSMTDGDSTNGLKEIPSPEAVLCSLETGRTIPTKVTSEPKTVFIDLRNWEQERNSTQICCKNGKEKLTYVQDESSTDSSLEEDDHDAMSSQSSDRGQKSWHDSSDCTGKSMLLRYLRKGSVNSSRTPGKDSSCALEQPTATDIETRVQKKRRKLRPESSKTISEQEKMSGARGCNMERGGQEVPSARGDQLTGRCPSTVTGRSEKEQLQEKHQSASENSLSLGAADQQTRECHRKEQQSRKWLNKQLDSLKPLRSVTGKHRSAEGTPLLFNTEASYLPNIHTLPEKERDEKLLLTVHLSSCGQLVTTGQQTTFSLDSAVASSSLYNALVSWLLSLVPTQLPPVNRPLGDSVKARAPFQVVGLQQVWQEEGLALYACVVPKCQSLDQSKPTYSKSWINTVKEKLQETSIFYQLVVNFLSQTSLREVIWWSKELNDTLQGHKFPPWVCLPATHLNSMISVEPDSKDVPRIFEAELGFFWQTLETEECCCWTATEDVWCVQEPEVTMALVFENLFSNPVALHHTLQLTFGSGMDICGLRLLYPSPLLLAESAGKLPSTYNPDGNTTPRSVLALALRGVNAGTLWTDIVGPSDPQLAIVTDRHSINARYCKHRDEPLLYSPHQESRIQWELCVWFGGRVPENGIVQVGVQNPAKKSSLSSRSNAPRCTDLRETCRPPATLVATVKVDLFLLVSPVVPTRFYGDIISVCVRRGFILQGLQRLRLSLKQAESLAIASDQIPVFCQTGWFGALNSQLSAAGPSTAQLPYPCFLMHLRKENASHQIASLLTGLVSELAEEGLIEDVRSRLPPDPEFEILSCFHVTPYTNQALQGLGGVFSAVPQASSLALDELYKYSIVSNPELEQVVVLTLTGRSAVKTAGSCLRNLLRPVSNKIGDSKENGSFELLGLKWLPHLSRNQAKELTPYEVGDRHWQESIDCLVSSPALVCVLRRVDAFNALAEILNVRQLKGGMDNLEKVMSPTPELAFRQAALFFTNKELISDPSARPLLKYLSPSLRSGISVAGTETQTDNMESIFSFMLLGSQPLLTLLVIKPSTWQSHLPKILRRLDLEHFCVVGLKLVTLDVEKASLLTPCSVQQDPVLVKSSIDSLISGPLVILCLQRDNAVKKLLDLLGPEDPQEARSLDQFLWRGHWGTDLLHNGFYASSSFGNAVRDVKAFFPEGLCCEESELMKAEKIGSCVRDWFISLEFPPRRKLVNSLAFCHLDSGAPSRSSQQGVLLSRALCQTMCLLLAAPLICSCHHPAYIEVLDQLASCGFQVTGARMSILDQIQAQHVAKLISVVNISATCALLTSGPCLILALERDNGFCCFDPLLKSLDWEKLNLQDCLRHFIYPRTESQVDQLLSCLFETLAPYSIHRIVPQDSGLYRGNTFDNRGSSP